jgi:tRNA threonylcarbamoyladenosine biosynthesis protein TsaB
VRVLAVETATEQAMVCIAADEGPLGTLRLARAGHHVETVAPGVEFLSRHCGVALAELELLAVDVGPGLFTGLRVGVGTVQALGVGLAIPVVRATSLELIAQRVAEELPVTQVVATVDARRGELFWAWFGVCGGSVRPAGEDRRGEPSELAAELAAASVPTLLAGTGALRYAWEWRDVPGVSLAGESFAHPDAEVLARLAVVRGAEGAVDDAASVTPYYLRDADVRINWERRRPVRPVRAEVRS